jgi:hypothetical protein
MVNSTIAFFEKRTGTELLRQDFRHFFSPVHPGTFIFDPVVSYDELTGRFVVAALDVEDASQRAFIDFAISNDFDPTHGFDEMHRFEVTQVSSTTGRVLWGDYPKLGWNADAYVFTLNMNTFPMDTAVFDHVHIIAVAKPSVLDRNSETLSLFQSDRFGSAVATHFTMAAATMHGSRPGGPMWFVEETERTPGPAGEADPNTVRVVNMANVLTPSPIFTDYIVPVPSYASVEAPIQPGGFSPVPEVIDSRILNAAFRGNVLVASQNVGTGQHTVARWYEFNVGGAVPTTVQSGDIDRSPGIDTYYPAIEIAANGDLGLSFIESSLNEFMSVYVTGRTSADPLGVMQTPRLVKPGEDLYIGNTPRGPRAGDYSGISVDPDPTNPNSFWAGNEYAIHPADFQNWGTWIAHFSLLGPEPTSTISRSRAFVAQVYLDLLERQVDPIGLTNWSTAFDTGVSPTNIVLMIEQSAEYRGIEVKNLYQTVLGRPADTLGLNNGINFLIGGTVEQLETILLGSPEFFQTRAGGTNAGFLNALYATVLGRAPDPVGFTHFAGMLSVGIPRDLVANIVVTSVEAETTLVESYYERFLHRAGDPTGLTAFVNLLHSFVNARQPIFVGEPASGIRDEDVIAQIVGSLEYFARV